MGKKNDIIKHKLFALIRKTVHIDPRKVDQDIPWYELGAESFDLVELIVGIREQFNMRMDTKDLSKVTTLNELVVFVEKNAHSLAD